MKSKKIITLFATLGLITSLYTKVEAKIFYDTADTRYEGATERLGELGIVKGVSEKTFEPYKTVTRAEFAKMIVETMWTEEARNFIVSDEQFDKFSDIEKEAWYYDYVVIAASASLLNGYEDGTFRPNNNVTYEEAAKIITKALGHTYLLENDPKGWATEYMNKLYELGITDDTADFSAKEPATRGNIAIMLWNALTENVWEKVYLNETTGFTYVESDQTLFEKRIKGHDYIDGGTINGFAEIDGDLHIQIGESYYRYFDQSVVPTFSMIGGKANALLKRARYPENQYTYEVVGVSSDIDYQLYSGTYDELKEEGFSLSTETYKVGSNLDYGYYLQNTNLPEADGIGSGGMVSDGMISGGTSSDRMVSVSTGGRRFYVEEVRVEIKNGEVIEDEKVTADRIKAENSPDYVYYPKKTPKTKTITINKSYVIADGAVLFKDNKRVDWKTLKKGDIVTEIKKDKYYFVSSSIVETTIENYSKKADTVIFETTDGQYIGYKNTQLLRYFLDEIVAINSITESELSKIKNKKAKLILDYAGRIARIEIIQNSEDNDLLDLNIGFYKDVYYTGSVNNLKCVVDIVSNIKTRSFNTTFDDDKANLGDLVKIEFSEEDERVVKNITTLTTSANINDMLKFKKETYSNLVKKIEKDEVADDVLVCKVTYYYEFGNYKDVKGFEVETLNLGDIEYLDVEKMEFYTVYDKDDLVRAIIIKDYSEQKDIFYGLVNRVYTDREKKQIRAVIDLIGGKEIDYQATGVLNFEEGDLISFKIPKAETFRAEERYSPEILGYSRDIFIQRVSKATGITSVNGTVNLEEGYISSNGRVYDLEDYTIIFMNIGKDAQGMWSILKADEKEPEEIELKTNDRIAIDEIEDTIIIYRGYKE